MAKVTAITPKHSAPPISAREYPRASLYLFLRPRRCSVGRDTLQPTMRALLFFSLILLSHLHLSFYRHSRSALLHFFYFDRRKDFRSSVCYLLYIMTLERVRESGFSYIYIFAHYSSFSLISDDLVYILEYSTRA